MSLKKKLLVIAVPAVTAAALSYSTLQVVLGGAHMVADGHYDEWDAACLFCRSERRRARRIAVRERIHEYMKDLAGGPAPGEG